MTRFQKNIYAFFDRYGRRLPWRRTNNPYYILVSEVMLQQTQVKRVLEKYRIFIRTFPTIQSLAHASLRKVLLVWQGLGYNRRAVALQKLAQIVVKKYSGILPCDRDALGELPGIGEATSGALCAFAFNLPVVFIETNIRSVFIHYFFKKNSEVSDIQLLPYIERHLDRENPRAWYYALMDYGVYLKGKHPNPGRKSSRYRKQTRFDGSNRQLRGKIIKTVLAYPSITFRKLQQVLGVDIARIKRTARTLCSEGLLKEQQGTLSVM